MKTSWGFSTGAATGIALVLHPPCVFSSFLPLPFPWRPRGLRTPEWHPGLRQGEQTPAQVWGARCQRWRGSGWCFQGAAPTFPPTQAALLDFPEHPESPQCPERPFCARVPLSVMFQTWPRCPRSGAGSYQRLALSQNPSAERLLSPNKLINPRNPPVADGRAARAPVPAQIRQLRASRDPPAAGKGGVGLIQLSLPCAGRGDGIGGGDGLVQPLSSPGVGVWQWSGRLLSRGCPMEHRHTSPSQSHFPAHSDPRDVQATQGATEPFAAHVGADQFAER